MYRNKYFVIRDWRQSKGPEAPGHHHHHHHRPPEEILDPLVVQRVPSYDLDQTVQIRSLISLCWAHVSLGTFSHDWAHIYVTVEYIKHMNWHQSLFSLEVMVVMGIVFSCRK